MSGLGGRPASLNFLDRLFERNGLFAGREPFVTDAYVVDIFQFLHHLLVLGDIENDGDSLAIFVS